PAARRGARGGPAGSRASARRAHAPAHPVDRRGLVRGRGGRGRQARGQAGEAGTDAVTSVNFATETDRELLRRYHEAGDAAAREALVERHLPLVRALARRYAGRGESLEDIEQVGAIGLIKAIDRYELSREVALTTYATPNVVGEIKRHFRDKGWAIR